MTVEAPGDRPAERWSDKYYEVLTSFFTRQQKVVLAQRGAAKAKGKGKATLDDIFDRERWDRELAADLYAVNSGAAVAAARKVMEDSGPDPDDFDDATVLAWLAANAEGVATGVNEGTAQALQEALEDDEPASAAAHVFGGARAPAPAAFTHKTWITRSTNPRPSHARLNGERVPVEKTFSNGARWPGDSDLDDDEKAGCVCDVAFSRED